MVLSVCDIYEYVQDKIFVYVSVSASPVDLCVFIRMMRLRAPFSIFHIRYFLSAAVLPPPPQPLLIVVHQLVCRPERRRCRRAAVVVCVGIGALGLLSEHRVRAGIGGAAEGGEAAVVELAKGDVKAADELGC